MIRQWYAIRTKPHKEFTALKNYQNQGFFGYLPIILQKVRHARKTQEVARPFFPGYLFLHLGPAEQDWPAISSTIGSLCPVKFGDRYPVVPSEIIDELKARENEAGYISFADASGLKKGQSVRVASGELEGLRGLFLFPKGPDRALVLLDMLQRQVNATVPIDSLEAA
jgi:transcriptional antiterminator RfaH